MPKPLYEDVVHEAALAIHRNFNPGFARGSLLFEGCTLTALIHVKYLGRAEAQYGFVQSLDTEVIIQYIREPA